MKELIINNMEFIISFVSMIVTWVVGKIIKDKTKISNYLIPIENAIIMIICVLIYYFATGDWSLVVATGSPVATLIYDVIHNVRKYNYSKVTDFEELELLKERDDE